MGGGQGTCLSPPELTNALSLQFLMDQHSERGTVLHGRGANHHCCGSRGAGDTALAFVNTVQGQYSYFEPITSSSSIGITRGFIHLMQGGASSQCLAFLLWWTNPCGGGAACCMFCAAWMAIRQSPDGKKPSNPKHLFVHMLMGLTAATTSGLLLTDNGIHHLTLCTAGTTHRIRAGIHR